MQPFENASMQRDSKGHVCQINHLDAPYRASRAARNLVGGSESVDSSDLTPRMLADQYLQEVLPVLDLNTNMLVENAGQLGPANPRE